MAKKIGENRDLAPYIHSDRLLDHPAFVARESAASMSSTTTSMCKGVQCRS